MKQILTIAIVVFFLAACQKKESPTTPPTSPPQPKTATAEARTFSPQASYADVIERVGPGVVTIHAGRRIRAPRQHPFFNDPLLREF